MTTSKLAVALSYRADAGFMAVKAFIENQLAKARAELETASADNFQQVQGRVKALRDLVQDLERAQ